MPSGWTVLTMVLVGLIGRLQVGSLSAHAVHVQHVQLGSKVTLSCNISYIHHTTWFKHNAGLPPAVVLCAILTGGQPVQVFQLGPRYSVSLTHRSLGLSITDVDDGDLGLYYCTARDKAHTLVGGGVTLQGPSVKSSWFHFHHWYCVAVGSALLLMVLTVCFIHFNFKPKRRRMKTHHCCSQHPDLQTLQR